MSDEPNPLMNWQMQALNLEFELAKMRPVYDAAMAASEAWANKFKQNHSPKSRQLFEYSMDTLAILCRRAKEGR